MQTAHTATTHASRRGRRMKIASMVAKEGELEVLVMMVGVNQRRTDARERNREEK